MKSTVVLVFSLLTAFVAATPTPANIAPRCGTTYYPAILQQLSEATPDTVGVNTAKGSGTFHVGQKVKNGSTLVFWFCSFCLPFCLPSSPLPF